MKVHKKDNNSQIYPIYSPRSQYKHIKQNDEKMIADITLDFDKQTINQLKQQFLQRNNKLTLQQFIIITKKYLKFWQNDLPNRSISLIRYLTFLFNQIDINGNHYMQWNQFTNYIIQKATVLKNLKNKSDEIKHYIRTKIHPKLRIQSSIQKCCYIQDIDKLAFYQQHSNKIYFMNITNGQISNKSINIDPKKLIVNISSVKKQKNGKIFIKKKDIILPTEIRVLDMLYLSDKKYQIILVSTSDCYIRGWKYSQNGFTIANQPDNQEELFQHYFSSEIYCMAWDEINQTLFCGQKNGNIYIWNLKTDTEKPLCQIKHSSNQKQCNDQQVNLLITSMVTMPKLQFLASGRMDGKLILWDIINNKKKWIYYQHTRGILTLTFNQSMILLFSAGFDHKICIWNPYISTLIHKIEGHLAPILSLKVIQRTHQLISVDTEGIVKITDTRRFNFIYSFSVQSPQEKINSSSLTSLMVIDKPLKLVFTGKSIYIYEYDKNYHPNTADQNTAICCKYVKQKLCFFTPMGNKIKVWSALNGDIQRIYMDITSHQISTFQFDIIKKRMIVGDTKGNITLHNTSNGAKLKTLTKHNGQVTHLIATKNDSNINIFISCALDNQIRIFKQTQQSYQIIRTILIIKQATITCLNYCPLTKLIIVGTNVGTLAFYDIQTGKTVGTYLNKSYQQFTSICQTKKSMIISSSLSGKIAIIAMPPLINRFQNIFSFYHQDPFLNLIPLGVRIISYSDQFKLLYVVDQKMYLTCYSLEEIYQINQMHAKVQTKVQSVRRQSFRSQLFQQSKIPIKWQIKAHKQLIKSLQYIPQQQFLATTSYDKKIKLWNAKTGEYLDSLQQNYNKYQINPIAFYNKKNSLLYSSNLKIFKQVHNITPIQIQFDPFVFRNLLYTTPQLTNIKNSNLQWKISVQFQNVIKDELQQFQNLVKHISEIQNNPTNKQITIDQNIKFQDLSSKFFQQKKMLKMMVDIKKDKNNTKFINNDENIDTTQCNDNTDNADKQKLQQQQSDQQTIRIDNHNHYHPKDQHELRQANKTSKQSIKRISNTYFRKASTQSLGALNKKKQNQFLTSNKKLPKNISQCDFIPISLILQNHKQNQSSALQHRKYIQQLSKRYTQSYIHAQIDHQAQFVNCQSQTAQKFFKMLNSLQEDQSKDKRPIVTKTQGGSRSLQSKFKQRKKLPKVL